MFQSRFADFAFFETVKLKLYSPGTCILSIRWFLWQVFPDINETFSYARFYLLWLVNSGSIILPWFVDRSTRRQFTHAQHVPVTSLSINDYRLSSKRLIAEIRKVWCDRDKLFIVIDLIVFATSWEATLTNFRTCQTLRRYGYFIFIARRDLILSRSLRWGKGT